MSTSGNTINHLSGDVANPMCAHLQPLGQCSMCDALRFHGPAQPNPIVIDLTTIDDEDSERNIVIDMSNDDDSSDAENVANNSRYNLRNRDAGCFAHMKPGCAIKVLYLVGGRKKWFAAAVDRVRNEEDPNRRIVDLYFDEDDKYVNDFELHADGFNTVNESGWKLF